MPCCHATIQLNSQNVAKATAKDGLNRHSFDAKDTVAYIWRGLQLPETALRSLSLTGEGLGLPSSFKIGHLAQSTIALSALAAALIQSLRNRSSVPKVTVSLRHACVEFKSERFLLLDGKPMPSPWGPIGGLHKTIDGYVRVHDNFPNHRNGALALLGLESTATRQDVAERILSWTSADLESEAFRSNFVISALRSFEEWDSLPQAQAIDDFPISIRKINDSPKGLPERMGQNNDKCLRALRVLEMSRVIAAPLAGKTLAAHGADVMWITSPYLPDIPAVDRDLGRGKRTVQLDIKRPDDKARLLELALSADVFIQGFRPGSLASHGLSTANLVAINPSIIVANISAYGPKGPWSQNRGFDSLVQTCSGMNASEAEHFGAGEPARPMPCQALDHAAGYLLATGILTALYKRAEGGGAYEVDVSLAGVMKYLRSLGQYPGKTGFQCEDCIKAEDVEEFLETKMSAFGALRAVKHSATIDGVETGWDIMPKPLGSDKPEWLD
ncbi:CoA-transferase family III [Lepidopterella palustris CBS 459.81]|uniref:CoA-transferase family III n=1 Tax=Lepidopterella palustris CBS 459.81 TaxID=1314670 RepID=A0A8E2JI79_9PEZI|nr:CoA-transferase family III [Lepidopterella palustris CBS 459.81]